MLIYCILMSALEFLLEVRCIIPAESKYSEIEQGYIIVSVESGLVEFHSREIDNSRFMDTDKLLRVQFL